MNIFITGATGYIGKTLCSYLIEKGYQVTIMAMPNENLNYYPFTKVNVVRANLVYLTKGEIDLSLFDCIVHMANIKGDYNLNVKAIHNLLQNIPSSTLKKPTLLFTSSLMAAGASGTIPRTELEEDSPPTPYGQSKKDIELIIQNSGLDYIILRPTAVIGGDNPLGEQLQKFINRGFIPIIKGGDKQKTSFIHVDDVVRAIFESIHHPESINQVFFLSSEMNASQLEVLTSAAEILDKKIRVITIPKWAAKTLVISIKGIGKITRSKKLALIHQSLHYQLLSANLSFVCSANKFETYLGWEPEVKSLDSALKSMLIK